MIGIFILYHWTLDSKYLIKSYDLEHGISGKWKTISSGSMSKEAQVSKYIVDSLYKFRTRYSVLSFSTVFFALKSFI